MSEAFKREKNGEHLYLRSNKLARSKQLRIEYPRVTEAQRVQDIQSSKEHSARTNILFVCSRNQWRSPTAEQLWRRHPALSVRSAGTSPNARHSVTVADLSWSDVVFVMEEKHKSRLLAEYRRVLENKPVHVLDIPDEYKYMDAELVGLLQQSVGAILGIE